MLESVRSIVRDQLEPIVAEVDLSGLYPEQVLRDLGRAGAYSPHLRRDRELDLPSAIDAIAIVAETCLSTAFCMWCQTTLGWYLFNAPRDDAREALLRDIASGARLGGTGLSNPMKALSGIERMKLRGKRVSGGYSVDGILPFVSNLGPDHPFGIVFETPDGRRVMAVASCDGPGITGRQSAQFCALEGTRTWTVRFDHALILDASILADPIESFLPLVRPGFILLQNGLGIGVTRGCIGIMRDMDRPLHHVNQYLDEQADALEERLDALASQTRTLARTPHDTGAAFLGDVMRTRENLAEIALDAARGAMLHTGARGYLRNASAQRKLREAYFFAILTPAIKHLRKEIAVSVDLPRPLEHQSA